MKVLAPHVLLLGLGGNAGAEEEVVARMRTVVRAVRAWGAVACSSVLRSAPIGPPQPDFLNAAVRIALTADWEPAALIAEVLQVEAVAGRDRRRQERWGPRTIDVDVLAWGARVARWPGPPELVVPHPRWSQRRFALAPAAEVLGDLELELPGTAKTLGAWLSSDEIVAQAVEPTKWRL